MQQSLAAIVLDVRDPPFSKGRRSALPHSNDFLRAPTPLQQTRPPRQEIQACWQRAAALRHECNSAAATAVSIYHRSCRL